MAEAENPQRLIALLRGLRAVRQFRPDPVPQEVVDSVLEVARWSGSAGNQQPWELVAIHKRETLQALAKVEGYAGHLAGAALRMVLAAAAYGAGSSIGWFKQEGRATVKKMLGIPGKKLVRTAISFGYPDEEARRARPKRAQARRPLSELVHEERYS